MSNSSLFPRQDWLRKSHFIEMEPSEVLETIAKIIPQVPEPVVLFDLDSTLYEVAPRNLAIIKDWLREGEEDVPQKLSFFFSKLYLI